MERNICNNNLLRFDPNKATTDQIRQWLFSIIDAEIDKDESEIDYDLIEQCTICEASLAGDPMALSDEEYQRDLKRIMKKRIAYQQKFISETIVRKPKLSVKLRILAVAAALAIAMFAALTVFAKVKGYKSAWDLIYQNFECLAIMEKGDMISENQITMVKNSGDIYYSSLEEFRLQENLNILLPYYIPNSNAVNRILLFEESDVKTTWKIQFTEDNLELIIKNYVNDITSLQKYETHNVDGISFYIFDDLDGGYQAVGQLNGYEYTLRYNDYKELIKILDNMKGIE